MSHAAMLFAAALVASPLAAANHRKNLPPPSPTGAAGNAPSVSPYRPSGPVSTPHRSSPAPAPFSGKCPDPHPLELLTRVPRYDDAQATPNEGAYFIAASNGEPPQVYFQASAGARALPVGAPSPKHAELSPDGRWLALTFAHAPHLQLWDTQGKSLRPLPFDTEVESLRWSAKSTWFSFVASGKAARGLELWRYDLPSRSAGEKLTALSPLTGFCEVSDISPDNKRIALWHRIAPTRGETLLFDLAEKKLSPLAWPGDHRSEAARFTRDGTSLWLISDDAKGMRQLFRFPLAGHAPSPLTVEPEGIDRFVTDPTRGALAYVARVHGRSLLRLFSTDGAGLLGHAFPVALAEKKVVTSLSVLPPAQADEPPRLFFTGSSSRLMPGLWRWKNGRELAYRGGDEAEEGCFGDDTRVRYLSLDGTVLTAYFFEPEKTPDAARVPPVVLLLHDHELTGGEPEFRPSFHPEVQYFRKLGYAILAPNYRGSHGYGTGFERLDDREKRRETLKDIIASADWARDHYGVPGLAAHLFGVGYGGNLALASRASDPARFGAVVTVFPVDWARLFRDVPGYRLSWLEEELGADRKALPAWLPAGEPDPAPTDVLDRVKAAALIFEQAQKRKGP